MSGLSQDCLVDCIEVLDRDRLCFNLCLMINLDTNFAKTNKMSLIEPRLSDLRSGFGGYNFGSSVSLPSVPLLPLWHQPPPAPPFSWCTIPNCPCAFSRSHLLSELYDYSAHPYLWSLWYLKAGDFLSIYLFFWLVKICQ